MVKHHPFSEYELRREEQTTILEDDLYNAGVKYFHLLNDSYLLIYDYLGGRAQTKELKEHVEYLENETRNKDLYWKEYNNGSTNKTDDNNIGK